MNESASELDHGDNIVDIRQLQQEQQVQQKQQQPQQRPVWSKPAKP